MVIVKSLVFPSANATTPSNDPLLDLALTGSSSVLMDNSLSSLLMDSSLDAVTLAARLAPRPLSAPSKHSLNDVYSR